MPTISQLPAAAAVSPNDQIPISQGGAACSVSVGSLLASSQPAILAPAGTLLGRTSLGPGGPDAITVGKGLLLSSGAIVATGSDHAAFAPQETLCLTDQAVVSSGGSPKLLQLSLLRGIYTAGSNVSIDPGGTISATTPISGNAASSSVANLSIVGTVAPTDLVAISHSGADQAISYSNFIDGNTINEVQQATTASDTDTLLVGQGGSNLVRQSLAAVWDWITTKLPGFQIPTIELTANTILDAQAHNGRILICSQPLALSVPSVSAGSFTCRVVNVGAGSVTFLGTMVSSSGSDVLRPGEAAVVICTRYSGGGLAYLWMAGSSSG